MIGQAQHGSQHHESIRASDRPGFDNGVNGLEHSGALLPTERLRKLALVACRSSVYAQQVHDGVREFDHAQFEQWMFDGDLDVDGLTLEECEQVMFECEVAEESKPEELLIDVEAVRKELQIVRQVQGGSERRGKRDSQTIKDQSEDTFTPVSSYEPWTTHFEDIFLQLLDAIAKRARLGDAPGTSNSSVVQTRPRERSVVKIDRDRGVLQIDRSKNLRPAERPELGDLNAKSSGLSNTGDDSAQHISPAERLDTSDLKGNTGVVERQGACDAKTVKTEQQQSSEGATDSRSIESILSGARQSGVQGVRWHRRNRSWMVMWHVAGKPVYRNFHISKYRGPGVSEEDADKATLAAAVAFRKSKEGSGKTSLPSRPSGSARVDALRQKLQAARTSKSGSAGGVGKQLARLASTKQRSKLIAAADGSKSITTKPSGAGEASKAEGTITLRVANKQSGVRGVRWHSRNKAWLASWYESGKQVYQTFIVSKFRQPGKSEDDAVKEALEAAIAVRKKMEASGQIQTNTSGPDRPVTRGVHWAKKNGGWRADIQINGKTIHGGFFKPSDDSPEELEKARLRAVERRREMEQKYFNVQLS